MTLIPDPAWPVIVMAIIVCADAVMTFRPPRFIADCLDGVGLPRVWWWVLAVVKFLATAGLMAGLWVPGLALAAAAGLIAYFLTAAAAHIRAGFTGQEFWLNCLGMLVLNILILVFCFLV